MDGKRPGATTFRRKRAVFYNLLQYAVERDVFDFNPIDKLRVHTRRPKVVTVIDRRVVGGVLTRLLWQSRRMKADPRCGVGCGSGRAQTMTPPFTSAELRWTDSGVLRWVAV
jgi:hypothetical protein